MAKIRYFVVGVRDSENLGDWPRPLANEQIHAKMQAALWPRAEVTHFGEARPSDDKDTE